METSGAKTNNEIPSYGSVERYLGDEGEQYFQRQSALGLLAGKLNEFIFKPYLNEQDDVLEFGCGGGFLLHCLNAKTKVGIDINPAARACGAKLGVKIYSTIEELDGRSFSKVITSHAMEHIPSPYEALVQLRKCIRPDGLLIWLSPLDDWRVKSQKYWKAQDPDMHLYSWTPLLMGNLLSAAGYQPKSISLVVHAFPPLRIGKPLWDLSPALFHRVARVWAVVSKRRQILAIASVA